MSVKSAMPHYPGHAALSIYDGKSYPGCKAKFFLTTWGFNRFFKEKPGQPGHALLVVHMESTPWLLGLMMGITAVYTKQLSPDEMQDMEDVTREIEFAMEDRRAKRRAQAEEDQKVKIAADEEIKRRALVGQKYEERVKHMKTLPPSESQRKVLEAALNAGDPEVLFRDKLEAFQAGYVHGNKTSNVISIDSKEKKP